MSDSLVLKGVKNVEKHSGSQMQLAYCRRGGDTHMLKRWWVNSPKNIVYTACTVFNVEGPDGPVKFVLETNEDSQVRIEYDGNYNFKLLGCRYISHAALFTADFKLIESYEISSGVGVAIKVKPGEVSRPTYIGELSVSGAPEELTKDTNSGDITASISGNAQAVSYSWTKLSGSGKATFTAAGGSKTKVKFDKKGTYSIRCTVASTDQGLTGGSPKTIDITEIIVS